MSDQMETTSAPAPGTGLIQSEDWLAVVLGCIVLLAALGASAANRAPDFADGLTAIDQSRLSLKELESAEPAANAEAARDQVKSAEEQLKKLTTGLFNNPLKSLVA